jgi:hypothetical protein
MQRPRDWSQIAALHGELVRLTGSAVVKLNRAIAVAETDGGKTGLALVDRLDLDGYQYFHSTRCDLLRRLGRRDEARAEYERALELATQSPSAASYNGASRNSAPSRHRTRRKRVSPPAPPVRGQDDANIKELDRTRHACHRPRCARRRPTALVRFDIRSLRGMTFRQTLLT